MPSQQLIKKKRFIDHFSFVSCEIYFIPNTAYKYMLAGYIVYLHIVFKYRRVNGETIVVQ